MTQRYRDTSETPNGATSTARGGPVASYTVQGHPLNLGDLRLANAAQVQAALLANGVGQTVNLTLSGPGDLKAKAHACLK